MKKTQAKDFFIDTMYYTGGSILYALGLYTFVLRAGFAPGGVSGISIIIHVFTGWPIGALVLLLNIPLVMVCWRVLGRRFLLKSMWAMLISAVFLDVVFPRFPVYQGSAILAAIFSGILAGAGMAFIYMRGSSTGGVDFLTMTVKKLRPHFSIGQITLMIDLIVILTGGIVFRNIDAVLYGILSSFAATMTIDTILSGAGGGKLAIIVTNEADVIAKGISAEVGRGSTMVQATGTYTGEQREMLYCVCSKSEIYRIRTTALAIDPYAMVMITEASEVFGEGFEPPEIPGNEVPHREERREPVDEEQEAEKEALKAEDTGKEEFPQENDLQADE